MKSMGEDWFWEMMNREGCGDSDIPSDCVSDPAFFLFIVFLLIFRFYNRAIKNKEAELCGRF